MSANYEILWRRILSETKQRGTNGGNVRNYDIKRKNQYELDKSYLTSDIVP